MLALVCLSPLPGLALVGAALFHNNRSASGMSEIVTIVFVACLSKVSSTDRAWLGVLNS